MCSLHQFFLLLLHGQPTFLQRSVFVDFPLVTFVPVLPSLHPIKEGKFLCFIKG